MVGSYIAGLPVKAIKVLAGFTVREGDYFLDRSIMNPAESLEKQVFPEVETWLEKFKSQDVEKDIAGLNFLILLKYLRKVLLQDSVVLKQKYPDHYLWSAPLFSTTKYREFENLQLASVIKSQERFGVGSHLETVAPEIAAVLKTGLDSVHATMHAIQAQVQSGFSGIRDDNQALKANLVNVLNAAASSIASVQQTAISSLSPPIPLSEPQEATETSQVPQYKMNRKFVTVPDIWREYSIGIMDQPSVWSLEAEHGAGWRKDRSESRFFSRRMVLVKEVEKIAVENHISCEEAAMVLERRRIEMKASLDKLRKSISNQD